MKVFMHNDGAIFSFLPTLIEMGVDILNPVQTTAAGMDPVKLKREFGDQLVFWGGGLRLPAHARLRHARTGRRARSAKPSASSPPAAATCSPRSTISKPNVPPENVIAMFDTALGKR